MAAEHFYYNGSLEFIETPLSFGGSISITPGRYVKGDPTLAFGLAALQGTLIDEGTGTPAAVTANPALLVFDEAGYVPAGYGTSGWSGVSGFSGTNAQTSGWSGATGAAGTSGYSGYSGAGKSGYSGFSGAVPTVYAASVAGVSGVVGVSGAGCTISTSGQTLWIAVP